MSDSPNKQPKHECACESGKDLKALKKEVAELKSAIPYISEMLLTLEKEVATLRKAVRK
jgi:hypothetical protein